MRFLVTSCFLLIVVSVFGKDPTLVSIREHYYKASEQKSKAESFMLRFDKVGAKSDPILVGYKGVASMLQAKYVLNPYNKLKHFNSGKGWLESAVKSSPSDVELRFLRFCIQTNAPFFLGYSDEIDRDKEIIMARWSALADTDLKKRIADFMLASDELSTAEKLKFR